MIRSSLILTVLALAACGADGPPMTPNASMGISVGSGGVSTGGSVGASNGTLSVGLGF
ncbi:MAG: hypothetical protein ACSHW1_04340 [Yoonia sp.]|uniref:hypothetical protein n=1 Tax=Yoonia sp. TaxID=2212373 RepID=UPI003EF4E911